MLSIVVIIGEVCHLFTILMVKKMPRVKNATTTIIQNTLSKECLLYSVVYFKPCKEVLSLYSFTVLVKFNLCLEDLAFILVLDIWPTHSITYIVDQTYIMFTDLVYCYTNMHKYPFDMRACVEIMNAGP